GEIPPSGRQGKPRGRERHRPRGEERGRSRTKRQGGPEVCQQFTSDSEWSQSSPDCSETGSDSDAAVDSSTLPPAARGPVVFDCLRQQCNTVTKEILRSLPAGANLADTIKHVVKEEQLTPIQAAVHTLTSAMACFKCGQAGHVAASCPTGVCWSCGKRGHLARDCRSRNPAESTKEKY
uniref:Uncharacterized protein n=1 Tax=Geospiza parvula TaxID=87175 RepID=A0A8U8CHN8_GEOPR